MMMAGTVLAEGPLTDTEIYTRLQRKALAQVHDAIHNQDANKALIWASTVTQLQAAEMAETMLVAKRTVVPNPEVTFPALKQLGIYMLGQELRADGAKGAQIMNLIEAFTSAELSERAVETTIESAVETFVKVGQAKAQYQAKAKALAQVLDDRYAGKGKYGTAGELSAEDAATVKATITEGQDAGWHVPYALHALDE
jgi:hypothetical protein